MTMKTPPARLSPALSLGLWCMLAPSLIPSSAYFTSAFAPPRTTSSWTTLLHSSLRASSSSDNVAVASEAEAITTSSTTTTTTLTHDSKNNKNNPSSSSSSWASHALLISSLSDGILPNPAARSFLRYSLVDTLLRERILLQEEGVRSSVEFSPCNGPDIDSLGGLEDVDRLRERGRRFVAKEDFVGVDADTDDDGHDDDDGRGRGSVDSWADDALRNLLLLSDDTTATEKATRTRGNIEDKDDDDAMLNVRILYIPTASYALNPQSSNTPGKQRQRARADGKKRRTQLLKLLEDLLSSNHDNNENNSGSDGGDGGGGESPDENGSDPRLRRRRINLLSTTLDLDDGSLKQPVGSTNAALFPTTDSEALTTWRPHLVYVEGGNTFWLQHCIDKGGYSSLIKNAVCGATEDGGVGAVYVGKSAGAIVAGRWMATATWKGWDDPSVVPGKEVYEDWMECEGFGFVRSGDDDKGANEEEGDGGVSFFPHMSDDWNDIVKEKRDGGSGVRGDVVCLREEDACCVIGERKLSFVASGQSPI